MPTDNTLDTVAIGDRLQLLRGLFDLTRAEMADKFSVDRTNYGRIERGQRMLPLDLGCRVAERCQVTMDWLYTGKMDHLSVEMAERIRSAA